MRTHWNGEEEGRGLLSQDKCLHIQYFRLPICSRVFVSVWHVKISPVGESRHSQEWLTATRAPRQFAACAPFLDTWVENIPHLLLYGAAIVGKILPTWGACCPSSGLVFNALPSSLCKASPCCCPHLRDIQLLCYCAWAACTLLCWTISCRLHLGGREGGPQFCHWRLKFQFPVPQFRAPIRWPMSVRVASILGNWGSTPLRPTDKECRYVRSPSLSWWRGLPACCNRKLAFSEPR